MLHIRIDLTNLKKKKKNFLSILYSVLKTNFIFNYT